MSDYISRDVAIIEFMDNDIDHIQAPNGKEAVQILSDIPAADVVPVVRCENCIHWSDSNQCARPELSGSRWHDPKYFDTYPDDFCSYGERKEQKHVDADA